LDAGDDKKFQSLVGNTEHGLILLKMDSGSLRAAIKIGNIIRARGFMTAVSDSSTCVFACSMIWIAGSKRFVASNAGVGFYIFSLRNLASAIGEKDLVDDYVDSLDLPQHAEDTLRNVNSDELSYLSLKDLNIYGFDAHALAEILDDPPLTVPGRNLPPSVKPTISAFAAKGLVASIAAQIKPCYMLPTTDPSSLRIVTVLRIHFSRDGNLSAPAQLVEQTGLTPTNSADARRLAEAAQRALLQCVPLHLPSDLYEGGWEDIEFVFDPRMVGK